ncbi:hypothetical protein [Kineosporia sp. A_224]|uniref:hypothetical protein n=1 Tax=Kineosporia sp. A_224 TaxID=1962180 RepID=UPI000B4BE9F9|nr:hypothetical protein [Kineosporia sp. A_224]
MSIVSGATTEGPRSPSSPRRLLLAAAGVVAVLAAGLVALQLSVGGVPLLDTLVPVAGSDLVVEDTPAPPLDCGTATAEGSLLARDAADDGRRDLAAAAEEQRLASPGAGLLVRVRAHRTGDGGVAVVWEDSQGRARLVLSYVPAEDGYVLAARSGCTAG